MKQWDLRTAIKMAVWTGALAGAMAGYGAHRAKDEQASQIAEAAVLGGIVFGLTLGGCLEESTIKDLLTLNFSFFANRSTDHGQRVITTVASNHLLSFGALASAMFLGQKINALPTSLLTLIDYQLTGVRVYLPLALAMINLVNGLSSLHQMHSTLRDLRSIYQTLGGLAPPKTPVVAAEASVTFYDEATRAVLSDFDRRLALALFSSSSPDSVQRDKQTFIDSFVPAEIALVNHEATAVAQANPNTIVIEPVTHANIHDYKDGQQPSSVTFTQHSKVLINPAIDESAYCEDLPYPVSALFIPSPSDPSWRPCEGLYQEARGAIVFDIPATESYTYAYDDRTGLIAKPLETTDALALVPTTITVTPVQPLPILLQSLVAMQQALPKSVMSTALVVYSPQQLARLG